MSLEEDYDNPLQGELELLQAIYFDELSIDTENGFPYKISANLHPSTCDNAELQFVTLTLDISLEADYPSSSPRMRIRNPRGLSDSHLKRLQNELDKLAHSRKGGPMLYDLIEFSKDSLTDGNIPQSQCVICLNSFEDDDKAFSKTNCYHYFHNSCLFNYIQHRLGEIEELKKEEALQKSNLLQEIRHYKVVCPVCLEPLTYDMDQLSQSLSEASNLLEVNIPDDIRKWQKKMSDLLEVQKAKGGIIDLEAEQCRNVILPGTMVTLEMNETRNSDGNLQNKGPVTSTSVHKPNKYKKRSKDVSDQSCFKEQSQFDLSQGKCNIELPAVESMNGHYSIMTDHSKDKSNGGKWRNKRTAGHTDNSQRNTEVRYASFDGAKPKSSNACYKHNTDSKQTIEGGFENTSIKMGDLGEMSLNSPAPSCIAKDRNSSDIDSIHNKLEREKDQSMLDSSSKTSNSLNEGQCIKTQSLSSKNSKKYKMQGQKFTAHHAKKDNLRGHDFGSFPKSNSNRYNNASVDEKQLGLEFNEKLQFKHCSTLGEERNVGRGALNRRAGHSRNYMKQNEQRDNGTYSGPYKNRGSKRYANSGRQNSTRRNDGVLRHPASRGNHGSVQQDGSKGHDGTVRQDGLKRLDGRQMVVKE